MPSIDLTDYVRTGETRVPAPGEFFIFDRSTGPDRVIVLQQNETSNQPRHASGAPGKGWTDEPREIVVKGQFKVGDRVRVRDYPESEFLGLVGVVAQVRGSGEWPISVDLPDPWNEGATSTEVFAENELALVVTTPGRRLTVTPGTPVSFDGESAVFEGDFEFEVEDLTPYVQVRYVTGGVLYTYRDPSGTLKVGDLVEVPVTYGTKVGAVEKLGRDESYSGPVKDVLNRLVREAI